MKKVLFIDRDGVINKDPGGWTKHNYVTRWEEFIFLDSAEEALKKLTEAGYEIIVISNQAGVNRGLFSADDLKDINEKMLKRISSSGGRIRSVHYCLHAPEERCGCRKPNTGLFKEAAKGNAVDFKKTFFIGDGSMDIEAGKKVGCKTILLLCGKTNPEDVERWKHKPDFIKKDLLDAVNWILKTE